MIAESFDSGTGRWDPRILLPAFLAVNAAALSASGIGLISLLVIPILALAFTPGVLKALPSLSIFCLLIVGGHATEITFRTDSVLMVSTDGLREGLEVAGRLIVLYGASALFVTLLGAVQISSGVRWYLALIRPRLADRVFQLMVLVFRFVPRLFEVHRAVRDAVTARRVPGRRRFSALARATVLRVLIEADRVSYAAQARRFFEWRPAHSFSGTPRSVALCAGLFVYAGASWLLSCGSV